MTGSEDAIVECKSEGGEGMGHINRRMWVLWAIVGECSKQSVKVQG